MRTFGLRRGKRGTYLVTDARRPMSEDIRYRQKRYLIMMGIRVAGLVLAVFLFHGIARFIAAAIAIVMPYFAVVFANGGREPDSGRRFQPYDPERRALPEYSSGEDPASGQDPYPGQDSAIGQDSYPSHEAPTDQDSYPGQAPDPGQDPYPGQDSYPGQEPYAGHDYHPGQEPYAGQDPHPRHQDEQDETSSRGQPGRA